MKKLNKRIAIFMCVVMVIGTLPVYAFAENTTYVCGDYQYIICDSDKALACLTKYNGTDEDLVIPETFDGYSVYAIGSEAFSNSKVKSVYIPDTVKVIKDFGFFGCPELSQVRFPKNLSSIGEHAFYWNNKIEHLEITAAWIYNGAFSGMSNLKSVVLHNTIAIKENAFSNDSLLESVVFDTKSLQEIGNNAFNSCSALKSIYIDSDNSTRLKLGEYAFCNCYYLEDVYINQIDRLSLGAFQYCQRLKSFRVNKLYSNIDESAFDWCYNLKELDLGYVYAPLSPDSYTNTSSVFTQRYLRRIEIHALETGSTVTEKIVIPRGFGYLGSCVCCKDIWLPDTIYAIADDAISDTTVIHGYSGTYAQQYAEDNGIEFQPIIFGDTDEDDEVTLSDYAFIKAVVSEQHNTITPYQRLVSDINGDTSIDSFDMFRVEKAVNGLN